MKTVGIGGTGLIGKGLAGALAGGDVVVDVASSPSFEEEAVPNHSLGTWRRVGSFDVLEVTAARTRSWTFVWPGRVVVEPLSEGVTFSPTGEPQVLPIGCVLVAEASAVQLRISAEAGAAFRVIFEDPCETSMPSSLARSPAPRLCVSDPRGSIATIFQRAFAADDASGPASWRIQPAVARAREYIERNLELDFDHGELSTVTGVARWHLCRVFQRAIGLPPYRFRAHLRIARARMMLAAGHDCATVAYAVGFCDQSHFTRCFKDLTSTTPGSYARACGPRASRESGASALSRAA
ncbi:MAG: Transcriptional regulator, AraC family [Labilithrix sp.]|nr:Transcriptional regulator, AraC family [Labilithrix sp.]